MMYNLKCTPLRRQQEGISQTTIWRKSNAGRGGDAHGQSGAFLGLLEDGTGARRMKGAKVRVGARG